MSTMHPRWIQRTLKLAPRRRGFHLITREVLESLPELPQFRLGLLHLFLQHTSASLSINENADPDVPRDLAAVVDSLAPENFPYRHTAEGPDDMPAHVKAALLGTEVTIPVQDGKLLLGVWQGIYLGEHRDHATARRLIATLQGETA
ncbi:MAG: secondary thiamine-phosphate synthase enzyme YjbQ [Pirellulales bacterium]